MMRRSPKTIDLAKLPDDKADELHRLVAAAKASGGAADRDNDRGGDSVSYTINVDDPKGSTELRYSDSDITQPAADLMDWIAKNG